MTKQLLMMDSPLVEKRPKSKSDRPQGKINRGKRRASVLFGEVNTPDCNTVEVSTSTNVMVFVIPCSVYNTTVIFESANDIVYLYRLSQEASFTYAKLSTQKNGLQDYVDAVTSLN